MIYSYIQSLINYSVKNKLINSRDELVIRNSLIDIFQLKDWEIPESLDSNLSIDEILDYMINYAVENSIIENTTVSKDLFDTKIMGIVTPLPHKIIKKFNKLYKKSPAKAADWYYDYNKKVNYIRFTRILKDLKWSYNSSDYGTLDITINLSKPEKDPKDIAKAKTQPQNKYPKCQLCLENIGFFGNINHPARQNLRTIPASICGEEWQLQYSPYGYYNEHCILFNNNHIPMTIDENIFNKLFDAVDMFPNYFFGSNADLPIVGGSILSHEHFQGGRYDFAMTKAPIETPLSLKDYPSVEGGILKWAMSAIRVKSDNRDELSKACIHILNSWKNYSDSEADIFSHTDGTPHNTITPIARKIKNKYECDLVLRNNRTSEEYPLGIFHPHNELHHIKKENIGLIEVMGLAILPSRLKDEIEALKELMILNENLYDNPKTVSHADWAEDILKRYPDFNEKNAQDILNFEIGAVFEKVLLDASVFKKDDKGKSAFIKFLNSL